MWFFFRKTQNFSKLLRKVYHPMKISFFAVIIIMFWRYIGKILKIETLENMKQKEWSLKKKIFNFLKAFFTKTAKQYHCKRGCLFFLRYTWPRLSFTGSVTTYAVNSRSLSFFYCYLLLILRFFEKVDLKNATHNVFWIKLYCISSGT